MPDLEEHIVSIWDGQSNKNNYARGSGFCIAPKLILTGWHVIKGLDEKQIHIGLISSTDSGLRAKKVHRIVGYDAAIIELFEKHKKPVIACDYINAIDEIEEVKLLAYHVNEKNRLKPLKKQISTIHKDNIHWHFDSYPAKGMSGGAVTYQNKAIGIIRAQNKINNDGVFLPLYLFEAEIKTILEKQTKIPFNDSIVDDSIVMQSFIKNDHYLKNQATKLQKHLKNLKENKKSQPFYNALIKKYFQTNITNEEKLQAILIVKLKTDATELVESLWICAEPYHEGLQLEIELLLLLLLTQLSHEEAWVDRSLHKLNVRTRVLSELQMSAHYDLSPSLKKYQKLGIAGAHIITENLSMKELGIDAEDNATQIAQIIAFKLYKIFDGMGDLPIDEMDEYEWEGVNETLKGLRKKPEFHRIEVDIKRAKGHLLLDKNVCNALYKLLPDLPITHFGYQAKEGETSLRAQVSLFFDMLYENSFIKK